MNQRDYIHNHSEQHPENLKVFSKTYEVIDKIASKITRIETAAFDITDHEMISALDKINAEHVSEQIIDLVNYAIQHYRKHGRIWLN